MYLHYFAYTYPVID